MYTLTRPVLAIVFLVCHPQGSTSVFAVVSVFVSAVASVVVFAVLVVSAVASEGGLGFSPGTKTQQRTGL
jgi:hypothetical protein